jgi:general secretion pathway protein A
MLTPLERPEVESYIKHRLEIAGAGEAVTFQPEAARLIADLSRGLPRRVNVICDRTLQEGRIQGASELSADLVKRAARSLTGIAEPVEEEAPAPATSENETVSPARRLPQLRVAAILVAASMILATAAYGYIARGIIRADAHTPQAPAALHRERALEAQPRPVPSAAELLTMFPPGLQDQLPHDRDEVD